MFLYGINILMEAIKSGQKIKRVYILEGIKRFEEIKSILEKNRIHFQKVPEKILRKLSEGEKNQGVVFEIDDFKYYSLEDFLKIDKKNWFLILLDQIQDPHNLGAIIRTAVCAGADGIVITKDRSAKVTPAVVKVSAGLIFNIPIIMVTNLVNTIKTLKEKGIWVYGADMKGKNLWQTDFKIPLALVMGNEGNGLRKLVKESCDELVSIPMKNDADSLNVSVSTGILAFEVMRQREYSG
ncbi:MAG: rRNA (guanosine2251-2-O)-methyltransferase [Thermotogaceae bacterium]|jgi:23S rRNA (guanosine2251-2'-O)-methyltransferase|nr:rRNA (guanosine2251-2-O)-methyltransferase [Thermotogaceae bacterium]